MITILDYITSIITVISLFLAGKYRVGWLIYSINCLLFSYVVGCKNLLGLCIMGLFLFCIGLHNYIRWNK